MKKTTIGEKIDDFITYKRNLGYTYDTPERYLKRVQTVSLINTKGRLGDYIMLWLR